MVAGAFAAFEQAVAARADPPPAPVPDEPGPAPATVAPEVVVADPVTGEIIDDLPGADPALLASLVPIFEHQERRLHAMRAAVEDELRDRLKRKGTKLDVYGDFEVSYKPARSRKWDPADLELVVADLVARDIVRAGDVAELMHVETVVNGRAAQRLLGALRGPPKQELEGCFTWEDSSRPKLTVTPVPDLADALPEAAATGGTSR